MAVSKPASAAGDSQGVLINLHWGRPCSYKGAPEAVGSLQCLSDVNGGMATASKGFQQASSRISQSHRPAGGDLLPARHPLGRSPPAAVVRTGSSDTQTSTCVCGSCQQCTPVHPCSPRYLPATSPVLPQWYSSRLSLTFCSICTLPATLIVIPCRPTPRPCSPWTLLL